LSSGTAVQATARPGSATTTSGRWTIWAGAVLINLTVWLLVSLGNGVPDYFWPMWLAVPGVVLGGVTAAVTAARSHR